VCFSQQLTEVTKPKRYIFNKEKALFPYENNCPELKSFIEGHFKHNELIDYDNLHKLADRLVGGMSKE
jgi:hypothetical protein